MVDNTTAETQEKKGYVLPIAGGVAAGAGVALPITAGYGAEHLSKGFHENFNAADAAYKETHSKLLDMERSLFKDGAPAPDAKATEALDALRKTERAAWESRTQAFERSSNFSDSIVKALNGDTPNVGKLRTKWGNGLREIGAVWSGSGNGITKTKSLMVAIPVVTAIAVGAIIHKVRGHGSHVEQIESKRAAEQSTGRTPG